MQRRRSFCAVLVQLAGRCVGVGVGVGVGVSVGYQIS